MISAGSIGTDANGNMLAIAGTATKQYGISSGDTHLVVPQTLAAGSVFSVKLANGNTYTAKLTQDVTLEAGKNTTLTLTLTPTTVGLKTTVADWGEAAAAAEVHLDGLTDGTVAITANEGDQLTVTYAQDNLTAVYTYTGGQWTSTAPLYWDDINREGFTGEFSAVYTYKTKTAPAEDKLTGKATNVTYGSELSFSLAHTTAKLTFTFKAGEGVTEDDIAGFTKTIALNGTDYTIAGDMHFAPYTLTATDVITLTRPNGNTYIVKLKDLKNDTADLFTNSKLEAGKHYAITLTVNETSVGIQASIAAWTEVTGSGTMTPDFTNP